MYEQTRGTWDARAMAVYVTGISHGTVAKIVNGIRDTVPAKKEPKHDGRTRFLRVGAMLSSDGVMVGRDKVFLTTIDEKSGKTVGYDLCRRENAEYVEEHMRKIVSKTGQRPMVWKHDNGPGFKSEKCQGFLKKNGIVAYPTRGYAPWTNGRVERNNKDLQGWFSTVDVERMSENEVENEAAQFVYLQNYVKPRAVLGYRTADSVYRSEQGISEDERERFIREVAAIKAGDATMKHRKAVKTALRNLGFYEEWTEAEGRPGREEDRGKQVPSRRSFPGYIDANGPNQGNGGDEGVVDADRESASESPVLPGNESDNGSGESVNRSCKKYVSS